MKLVILTNNNSNYGKQTISHFHKAGISIEAIVAIKQPLSYKVKLFNFIKRRVGFLQAIIFSIKEILSKDPLEIKDFNYNLYTKSVVFTNGTNTKETENALKKLQPDIIFLAQTGIVRKNILSIPKIGVLNSHPGILPEYRGIDCYKWAILNNEYDKIGNTLHWVDTKVDTGNIIAKERLDIQQQETLSNIGASLSLLGIDLATKKLIEFANDKIDSGTNQLKEEGKQYYKMSLQDEKKIEQLFQSIRK
ncbi:MAG: hypothetical protein GY827_09120 [Cytophagales bacterium]|nr:hypothetical protein [Cytophagales bacterium]